MPKIKTEATTIDALTPDSNNANAGTQRGSWMLKQSVEQCGIGRGIVADRHGNIIGGNKTAATVEELGYQDVIMVPSDGTKLVVTVREDLDLTAPHDSDEYQRARTLSIADNRAAEVSLSWDESVLADYETQGIEIDDWWNPDEYAVVVPEIDTHGTNDAGEPDTEPIEKVEPERQGQVIPLAIALTSSQFKEWQIIKETASLASDTAVFLKLMYGEL